MTPGHGACIAAAVLVLGGAARAGVDGFAVPGHAAAVTQSSARQAGANDPYRPIVVTGEMRAHERWIDSLYFADNAFLMAMFAALLGLGGGRRLRMLAVRITTRPFPLALITSALFIVLMAVLLLPLAWLGGFWVPHHFGLSGQSAGSWLLDQGKELLIGLALGAPLLALALAAMRRMRRWWLGLWLASVPLLILLQVVAPVALDPIFNRFQPLRDQQLRAELLDLATQAGIEGGRVYEVDKSRQTKTLNAYVNGLGPTKRIVLWDTIIAAMDRDELKFVMAHEMGHYVLGHMWALLAYAIVALGIAFGAGQWIVERATASWGPRWGFSAPGDAAALPLLALVASAFVFLSTPATSAFSRHLERQADTFAIELTHLNDAGAGGFVKLAESAKVPPDPPPFIRFWRYTHPSFSERIAECRNYRPWERGEPNRVWRPVRGI